MSEQMLPSEELLAELRTPEELFEMLLLSMQTRAKQILDIRFDSLHEAQMVMTEFNTTALEQLNNIEGLANIEVTLNGEGVRIPNNTYKNVIQEDEQGIAMMITTEDSLRSLEPYETESGYVEGVWAGVTELDDSKFQVGLHVVVALKEFEKQAISLPGGEVNILEMNVIRRALVKLDGSADLVIAPLEEIRGRYILQTEIAKHGLAHTLFMAQLNKLDRALHSEDKYDFKDLAHVKILQRLGALGEIHARKGYGYSSTVSQAILNTIGNGRKVGVGFSEKVTDDISTDIMRVGTILEILMPCSSDDTMPPTLVIEATEIKDNGDPISIPFNRITAFKF